MNKRLIAFLSILSLFLPSHLIPANATAKAGAKCNKVGSTEVVKNKSYTCVKSGKKLVWKMEKYDLEKVVPVVTPTPISPTYLNIAPPSLGELTSRVECLKTSCVYNGPIPPGSVIVALTPKDEWNIYGVSNGVTHFSFKKISPTGKVTTTPKYQFPYNYTSTTFETEEIGNWQIQMAAWIGDKQTEWSSPKSISISVLPQRVNGLPKCSAEMERALQNGAYQAGILMKSIEDGLSKWKYTKDQYQLSQLSRSGASASWLRLAMQWEDFLRQRYATANGLYASYEDTKRVCNTSVDFPTYIKPD